MSKRSEEAALTAYPVHIIEHQKAMGGVIKIDTNTNPRFFFTEGYERAENNVISLIESRIGEILGDAQPNPGFEGGVKRIDNQNQRTMKIIRFDTQGYCQFIYFDWREFKFKTTCWAQSLDKLLGAMREKKHFIIGLWNYK